nr:site-specific integrase [Sphingomonas formosensis]
MRTEADVDEAMIEANLAARSPHSIRALKLDLEAFNAWCRRTNRVALPSTPENVADYLDARAGQGAKPASLDRYKASIAKIHQMLQLKDPTQAALVKLRLLAIRREKGTAQSRALPLRLNGPVKDTERDEAPGIDVCTLLEACADDLPGLRDCALLSVAYESGLRASELVAIEVAHLLEAPDPEARLLSLPCAKGDLEGKRGVLLSPRSVRAIAAWTEAAGITSGPLFRRVQVRRYKARPPVKGRRVDSISSRETWDLRKTLSRPSVPARTEYDVGATALHPGSIGPIWRALIRRAFDRGAFGDLTAHDLAQLLKGISAHSTRVGLSQDLFAGGEDLFGIMGALRWKSPRMPLEYGRKVAAEAGAVRYLSERLERRTDSSG